jgi:hypothetical protein
MKDFRDIKVCSKYLSFFNDSFLKYIIKEAVMMVRGGEAVFVLIDTRKDMRPKMEREF